MYDPNLDWVKLRGYDEKISRTPAFVQELKEYELQEMLLYTAGTKNKVISDLDALWRVEGQQHYTTDNFPEWGKMEWLEATIKEEMQRRKNLNNIPAFAQGSIFDGLPKEDMDIIHYLQGIINMEAPYFNAWEDAKKQIGDPNLSEERFLNATIDFCIEQVKVWEGKEHRLRRHLIPLYKECKRVFEARLTEIRKGKKKEPPTDLPPLEEVVKNPEKLPELWSRLSKMGRPLVSKSGTACTLEKKGLHAGLFAFSQALRSQEILSVGVNAEDAYYILCARFNIQPTTSIRQVRRGKRDYKDHLDAFIEVIREIFDD